MYGSYAVNILLSYKNNKKMSQISRIQMFYIYLCHSKGREIITRSKTSTFGPIPCLQKEKKLKYENKELQLLELLFAKYIEPPLIYHQLSKFSTSTVTFLP